MNVSNWISILLVFLPLLIIIALLIIHLVRFILGFGRDRSTSISPYNPHPVVVTASSISITHQAVRQAVTSVLIAVSHLLFPSQVKVGKPETLKNIITKERLLDTGVNQGSSLPVQITIHVNIIVQPVDFKVEGDPIQAVNISSEDQVASSLFHLTPQSEGLKVIGVEWICNGMVVGRDEIETTATTADFSDPAPLIEKDTELTWSSIGADLTLLISKEENPTGIYRYRFQVLSTIEQLNRPQAVYYSSSSEASPIQLFGNLFGFLNEMAVDIQKSLPSFLLADRLEGAGVSLYQKILPEEIKALYWNEWRTKVKNVLILSDEPWIPWEMLRPVHPESLQATDGFWCEKFAITRWIRSGRSLPPVNIHLEKMGIVTGSFEDMTYPDSESNTIKKLLEPLAEQIPADEGSIYGWLKHGGYSAMHFICHGSYEANQPDSSWLELNSDTGLKLWPDNILNNQGVLIKDKPLIFINACESGRLGYGFTGLGGWAKAFIPEVSSCFIGPIWKATNHTACRFAVEFYRCLLEEKMSIGEAAQKARLSIKDDFDPTWLGYVVYAAPHAVVEIEGQKTPPTS